jgi:intracellular sulfur oxidation DsrE/DsrF family protein
MAPHTTDFSDEKLNAFVDGELEWHERDIIFKAMEHDELLVQRLCELRDIKELVKHALIEPDDPPVPAPPPPKSRRPVKESLALMAMLAAGGIACAFVLMRGDHQLVHNQFLSGNLTNALPAPEIFPVPRRVLVHVSDARSTEIDKVLEQTEQLLRDARAAGQSIEIELIANSQGIAVLEKASPVAARIAALTTRYPNLKLYACSTTLQRRYERGENIALLSEVDTSNAAVDLIVDRLKRGWYYFRA